MAVNTIILVSSAEIGGAGSLMSLSSSAEIAATGGVSLTSDAEIAAGLLLTSSAEITVLSSFDLSSSAEIRDGMSLTLASSAEILASLSLTLSSSATIAGLGGEGVTCEARDAMLFMAKEGRPFNTPSPAVDFVDFIDQGVTPTIFRLELHDGVVTVDNSPLLTGVERVWLRDTATETIYKLEIIDGSDTLDTGDPLDETVYDRITLQDQDTIRIYNLVVTDGAITIIGNAPASLWNATEDPTLPMDADSLAALVCDRHILTECKNCVSGDEFAMASTADLTIKRYTPEVYERSVYNYALDATFYPVDSPFFPNTSVGSYSTVGFATIIQSEATRLGNDMEKFFTGIKVDLDAKAQTIPGRLYAQAGTSNSSHCLDWHNSKPITIDCIRGLATDEVETNLRPAKPASFSFYRAGAWVAFRLFVADGETDGNYAPIGAAASFNKVVLGVKQKNASQWNQ